MHLVYLDESGNTGTNLKDSEQPIFVLAALIVPETCWRQLEKDLVADLSAVFPENPALDAIEAHAGDVRSGRAAFKGVALAKRIALRNQWLAQARKHGLKLVYRAINKKKFERWVQSVFGTGVLINPHVAAFPLVAMVVNQYLGSLTPKALGMFISDENKEIMHDVEKSIQVLRASDGALSLDNVVEKGFFIDSRKSRVLQLCDLCALTARKAEEIKEGRPESGFDRGGAELIGAITHRGEEKLMDVLAWLAERQSKDGKKKERPGT